MVHIGDKMNDLRPWRGLYAHLEHLHELYSDARVQIETTAIISGDRSKG